MLLVLELLTLMFKFVNNMQLR